MFRDAVGYGISVLAISLVLSLLSSNPVWILVAIVVFGAITTLGKVMDSQHR